MSTTPEANAAKVKKGEITIEVKYDKNVFFATEDLKQISFTGGTLISADVYGSSNVLALTVNVPERETLCTLSIPEGVVLGIRCLLRQYLFSLLPLLWTKHR